jgi:hypothetical protein
MPKRPLQITTRTPKTPDFKFELLPLHSPLLGQSLLVSFPPLIDMLKFSGYPYLIRGQECKNVLLDVVVMSAKREMYCAPKSIRRLPIVLRRVYTQRRDKHPTPSKA